jgi:hypothetical protein
VYRNQISIHKQKFIRKENIMNLIEEFFLKNIMDEFIYIYGMTEDEINMSISTSMLVDDIKERDIDDNLYKVTLNDIVNIFFDDFAISEDYPNVLFLYRNKQNTAQIAMADDLNEWNY